MKHHDAPWLGIIINNHYQTLLLLAPGDSPAGLMIELCDIKQYRQRRLIIRLKQGVLGPFGSSLDDPGEIIT